MSALRINTGVPRYEQDFTDAVGKTRLIYANYADKDGLRLILRVEAEPELRGTGSASRFMKAVADQAREDGLKLHPICPFAKAWFSKNEDYADVLAD